MTEVMNHDMFIEAINELAKQIKRVGLKNFPDIYGIKRGGQVVAVYLSHRLGLPITESPSQSTLVVDDVCEKGNTLSLWVNRGNFSAVLYYNTQAKVKPNFWVIEMTDFIRFPWETKKSAKVDYDHS